MTEKTCTHGEDGKPFGYPRFPCPWPTCQMGTLGTYWAIPGEGMQAGEEYKRVKQVSYSWEKIK